MADISNITLPNGENYDIKDKAARNDIAINRTTLGTQCKNLLKNNAVTKTVNGVTFTVNSDGSVTVNGTNTSSSTGANLEICSFKNYGTGKLTASLNSTDSNLYMSVFDNSWVGIGSVCDSEITWDNGNKERLARLVVKPGATVNNVTVYPMIRYADITDDTYEPYKESVDERLIQNKSDIAVNKSTLGYQCKNLLKNNAATKTVNGVTFTINDDKSITVNGTATAQISFMINNKVGLGIGNYILTGCPSGGSWNTFYLTAYASSAWLKSPDFGSGCEIENKTVTQVVISIASGYTANNLKFYPMLRDADITDGTYELYKKTVDEMLTKNKSDIAVNKSALGYQRKNLLPYPKSIVKGGITFTCDENGYMTGSDTTDDRRLWTSDNAQYSMYLEAGTYYFSSFAETVCTSRFGMAYVIANGKGIVGLDTRETHDEKSFTLSEATTIYVLAKVFDGKIAFMIRDADIIDDTYEPYQPSLQEQTPYSLSVSSKSTSAVISYNGVPTLICLTPSESVSSGGGGLYLINSVGTAVYLIDKTGIVINTDTTNRTFTITNNTASTYDIYISCAYKKE